MNKLTDYEKGRLRARLIHFLRDHQYCHNLNDEDVANDMNVDLGELQKMLAGTYEPLIQAVEVLTTFADLKKKYGQNPGDLLDWMLGTKIECESKRKEIEDVRQNRGGSTVGLGADANKGAQRLEAKTKLYDWEQRLLHSFDVVGIPLRKEFVKFCEESRKSGGEELTEVLRGVVADQG